MPEPKPPLTDENRVPAYTLPDSLRFQDGSPVASPGDWPRRRSELLGLFQAHVYGRPPRPRDPAGMEVISEDPSALGGLALRREYRLRFAPAADHPGVHLLLWLPRDRPRPPAFLGLNFHGNHTVHPDPGIHIPTTWVPDWGDTAASGHRASADGRGSMSRRWPVETILRRGYALATIYYGDLMPDDPERLAEGVPGLLPAPAADPSPDAPGAISAWAWGLSRGLDLLLREEVVDPERVAVIGHSRLGKAALWAGALDERFSLVVSNNSGCGGAALSRRTFGETVAAINHRFPHWFCRRFRDYDDRETDLPVDQHQLLALAAPRPLYVASATEDFWADPKGEFLAAVHAGPAYRLFGKSGLGTDTPPNPGPSIGDAIGYHLRSGPHDLLEADWRHYLAFADRHFARG
ncbi:MAG: acetylxylan esterase [Puniceicoccaceae bacterium]|nr:MAG: acetylxylan esterase [Puniceicoccaceae bacterium]